MCLPVFVVLQFLAMVQGIGPTTESVRHTAMAVAMVLVVSDCARDCQGFASEILTLPTVVFVGRVSYGLYLFHNFVPHLVRPILGGVGFDMPMFDSLPPGLRFAVLGAMTLVIATLSWFVVERPFLSLKRHFTAEPGAPRSPN